MQKEINENKNYVKSMIINKMAKKKQNQREKVHATTNTIPIIRVGCWCWVWVWVGFASAWFGLVRVFVDCVNVLDG